MKLCIRNEKILKKYVPETIGKNNRFNKEKTFMELSRSTHDNNLKSSVEIKIGFNFFGHESPCLAKQFQIKNRNLV